MANRHIKVNKSNVEKLQAGATEQFYWDDKLSGFGVRVSPKGLKSFIFQYRLGGKQRRISIGRFGPMAPDKARIEALKYAGQVAQGTDPKASFSQTANKEVLLKDLCAQYLQNACGHKKSTTLYTDVGRIKRHILPLLGNMPVKAIERFHIQQFMNDIAAGKTAQTKKSKRKFAKTIVQGGKGTASRTVGLLGSILSYACDLEIIDRNPCHGFKRFKDNVRNRHLTAEEWARLGTAMTESQHLDPVILNAIRFLMFTGCRVGEATKLKWEFVNLDHGRLYLPDSKTGEKVIPLGRQAVELLREMQCHRSSNYVFSSAKADHIVNPRKTWLKLCEQAEIEDFRLHDLRHAFATAVVNSAGYGDRLLSVQKILGHKDYKSTLRYAHLFDDGLKNEASVAAEKISQHLNGGMEPPNERTYEACLHKTK